MADAVRVTAAQAQAKWLSRLSGATQEIRDGVNRVTTAPGQLAAAKKQKWLSAVTQSADKWAHNVSLVTLEQWKNSMLNYGVDRVASGAQAKQDKVGAFMTQFLPFLNNGLQRIKSMPDTTPEQRIQRMIAMVNYTSTFKRGQS